MVITFDLDIVYKSFICEKTSKEFEKYFFLIFGRSGHFRPISATNQITKISKKMQKIAKNAIFQNSKIFYIVAGNMIFGRKLTLWTPESPQKAYIDHPTQYDRILRKIKKIRFLTSKIKKKFFFSADYSGRCDPAAKTILGIKTSYQCPKGPIMSPYPHTPFTPIYGFKFSLGHRKINIFSQKCCFCCFCCFLGVANVVFQNLVNQEMLLPIFIFFSYDVQKKSYSTLKSCSERGGHFLFLHHFGPKISPEVEIS